METQHTDAPWQIEGDTIIGNIDGGYGDDGSKTRHDVICTMHDSYCEQLDNWKANARLIAAAPATAKERDELKTLNAELLEVLEKIAPYIEDLQKENFTDASVGIFEDGEQTKVYIRMRETIKKAKGQ